MGFQHTYRSLLDLYLASLPLPTSEKLPLGVPSRVCFSSHMTHSPPAMSSISMARTKSHMFTPKPVSKTPTVPPSSGPPYPAVYRMSPKPYLPRLIAQPVQNYPFPPPTPSLLPNNSHLPSLAQSPASPSLHLAVQTRKHRNSSSSSLSSTPYLRSITELYWLPPLKHLLYPSSPLYSYYPCSSPNISTTLAA